MKLLLITVQVIILKMLFFNSTTYLGSRNLLSLKHECFTAVPSPC